MESRCRQGITHYMDVAFVSDADCIRFFGVGIKALGLLEKAVDRSNEDGQGTTQGLYMRIKDLDELSDREIMALPKTRIWSEAHALDGWRVM